MRENLKIDEKKKTYTQRKAQVKRILLRTKTPERTNCFYL